MEIKISEIKKAKPCKDRWNKFKSQTKKYQRLTTIEEIVNFNGVSDSLWIIANVLKDREALIELSKQFVDSVKDFNNFYSEGATHAASVIADTQAHVVHVAHAVSSYAYVAARVATTASRATGAADVAERKKQKQMIINYYKDK